MKRELLLLRHGKSDWSVPVGDTERPLTARGRRDAERVGAFLWARGLRPDHVRASPAARARVTAEKACRSMDLPAASIAIDRGIYEASVRGLLQVLARVPSGATRALLVGHNPSLEELLCHLVPPGDVPAAERLLPTCALARIAVAGGWDRIREGSGQLLRLWHPSDLPRAFPYPAPAGRERRRRPAYFYDQSGVVPYRFGPKGEIEILLVGTSNRRAHSLPKGIIEPGLTPQESAAREALEEAGILGRVDDAALGVYTHRKWGAICKVRIYPMKVSRLKDGDDWLESHRGRRWVDLRKAMDLLPSVVTPLLRGLEADLRARRPRADAAR